MPDVSGIVDLDSEFGKQIGFTSDKFGGYLWWEGNRVTISFIVSNRPGKGNLSALFKAIESLGYRVAVPTPFARMQAILVKKGFAPHAEHDPNLGDVVEIWEKPE